MAICLINIGRMGISRLWKKLFQYFHFYLFLEDLIALVTLTKLSHCFNDELNLYCVNKNYCAS